MNRENRPHHQQENWARIVRIKRLMQGTAQTQETRADPLPESIGTPLRESEGGYEPDLGDAALAPWPDRGTGSGG